jgi:uncharacterized membrane protein
MSLSTAWRATLLGAATGMRSMTGLAAVALTTPRGAHPAWVGRLGGRWGRSVTSVAAAGELLTDKSVDLPSRLEPQTFGQRLTMGAVNGTALARREGVRPVLPALLAVAGAAAGTSWACGGGRTPSNTAAPPRGRWWRTSPPSAWPSRRPGTRARRRVPTR